MDETTEEAEMEDEPLIVEAADFQRRVVSCDLREANLEANADGSYNITIFANEKVRSPVELALTGLGTRNYMRNPVVNWGHNTHELPIGRTHSLDISDEHGIQANFSFLPGDAFARRVQNAWDEGFLRAASVSWKPIKSKPTKEGWIDLESDLLEWSLVNVPADPDALREVTVRLMDAYLERAEAEAEGKQPKAEDILEDLDTEGLRAVHVSLRQMLAARS